MRAVCLFAALLHQHVAFFGAVMRRAEPLIEWHGTVAASALEQGLLLNASRPGSLRFMPVLNLASAEIEQMVVILGWVLV